jgi:hypothetical protein
MTNALAVAAIVVCASRVAHAQPDEPEPPPPPPAGSDAPLPPAPATRPDLSDLPDMPLTDAQIIGADANAWKVEDVQFRTAYLSQYGHGFQSQDGSLGAAGSEAMHVEEFWGLFDIRQNDHIVHEVMIPVDIITAASPDAVDAISTASRTNESVDVDVRTTITASERDTYTTRLKFHIEEPLSGGTIGAGYVRHLADDNATLGVDANLNVDGFDQHNDHGTYLGKVARETANANITGSQLLSPTTVVEGAYGATYQHGVLDPSGWNAVPVADGTIVSEKFPDHRFRQDFTARLSQIIPFTRTTLKVWYRYYMDDFDVHAHTVEVDGYQYLVPWLYLRGSYRYHTQDAVDFFTTRLMSATAAPFYTADSDLAAFDANEWTAQLVVVRGRAPSALKPWTLSAEVMQYWRTNDLRITMVSLSAGRTL